MTGRKRKKHPRYTARTADKHVLYQESVQAPEAEVAFCRRVYQKHYGVDATLFREDFCGTFLISCAWVKKSPRHYAWGIDLHRETLDWGRAHNLSKLNPSAQTRVHLLNKNVLDVTEPKVHIAGAFNFSFFIFKDRDQLVAYFKKVRASLLPKGIFVTDAYGGWDSQKVMQDKRRCEGFTYVWDQAAYDPTDDSTTCHIHFKFPDGTMMKRAFSYDWRLWTLGSIR
ncbi:MAG TPA: class I SAM-dependent methyltransferase, partial [Phycisphaerae bacterium]|nr:class I SAM-dependent methyltransferase [Phycisphaerae bacterium]